MALAPAHGPGVPLPTGDRLARRMLKAEKAQLAHWRRLLRARLDLAVAGLAPPDHLGTMTWDLLPDAVADLPSPVDLRSAVTVPSIEDTVELMNRIRDLDRSLGRYARHIDAALEDDADPTAPGHDLSRDLTDLTGAVGPTG